MNKICSLFFTSKRTSFRRKKKGERSESDATFWVSRQRNENATSTMNSTVRYSSSMGRLNGDCTIQLTSQNSTPKIVITPPPPPDNAKSSNEDDYWKKWRRSRILFRGYTITLLSLLGLPCNLFTVHCILNPLTNSSAAPLTHDDPATTPSSLKFSCFENFTTSQPVLDKSQYWIEGVGICLVAAIGLFGKVCFFPDFF